MSSYIMIYTSSIQLPKSKQCAMPLILSPDLDYYGGMDMKHIGDLV